MYKRRTKIQIGETLWRLRTSSDFTQKDVADYVGTTSATVSRWERGENQPDLDTFFKLCDYYNADIATEFGLRDSSGERKAADPGLDEIVSGYYDLTPQARSMLHDVFTGIHSNPANLSKKERTAG